MLGGNVFGYFTDLSTTKRILDRARELRVTAIDTADVYSDGISEEHIGESLHNERASWFIASKVGLKSHASSMGLGAKANIIQRVERSLKRLKTDYLDLYQIHHFDPQTPLEETLEAFQMLIQQGKILTAGISNYDEHHIKKLKEFTGHCFAFNQIPLNIANTHTNEKNLQECSAQNIQIIAYASLMRGLFHEKYLGDGIPENSRAAGSKAVKSDLTPEFLHRLKETSLLAQRYQTSLLSIALHWLKRLPSVRWTIIGCRTADHLSTCFQAWKGTIPTRCLEEAGHIWKNFSNSVVL